MSPRVCSHCHNAQKNQARAQAMNGWGWGAFVCELIIAYGFLAFGLTHFAFARPEPGDTNRAAAQQTARALASKNQAIINSNSNSTDQTQTTVTGNVSWNNGVPRIADESTGRVFILSNARGVKALWDAGVKYVAVSGHVTGAGTLEVDSVNAP